MAQCKNVGDSSSGPFGGDGGDGGDSPPCTTEVARDKRKMLAKKKRTREEHEAAEALAVARATDCAERGGRGIGILIGDSHTRVPLTDRVLGTEATEEAKDQLEEQEQPSPPRHRSRRTTCSQATPAAAPERPR
jgi:hypothetical protein